MGICKEKVVLAAVARFYSDFWRIYLFALLVFLCLLSCLIMNDINLLTFRNKMIKQNGYLYCGQLAFVIVW